ncbi:MAG: cytosolic iron-sulfur protein assembly [Thelocarpon impressellum]|nr:MAG: cytosolic iron-sulfur protein assembly [Thelocarpon impressellum]
MADLQGPPPPLPPAAGRTLTLVSALSPPSSSRAWLSAPHPYLPLVATCSSDRIVRVYSLLNFKLHSQIEGGHKRSIRSCAWKPTGNFRTESVLATGSFDASAGIWRRWNDQGERAPPREAADADGQESGTGTEKEEEEDDDSDWRFAVILDGHESEIKSVAWSPSGQYLATCSRDKSVWIWEELDDDTFETIAVLQEHDGDVKSVVWHPEEELLASASYDDTIRLYKEDVDDWLCVALLKGHASTVWAIDFSPPNHTPILPPSSSPEYPLIASHLTTLRASGPRLISCSDDRSIRVWRRTPPTPTPTSPAPAQDKPRIPSILRTSSSEQEWLEETSARLPQRHNRAVYSVAWSKRSGRVVSGGGDGRVVVYEERFVAPSDLPKGGEGEGEGGENAAREPAEWVVVAEMEAAHGVFEVNHVCWATRFDKGRRSEDEEVILSTGDDGIVRVWALDLD